MKNKIKFLPLLFIYIIIVLAVSYSNRYENLAIKQSHGYLASGDNEGSPDDFVYDESRYVMFSTNLTHGYYSPRDNIDLWVGPGYPIILVPFVLLKLPWLVAKLMNPLFLYMAILYFFYTLRFYLKERTALLFSYLLGVNPPFLRHMPHLMTEVFVFLLVCGFIYHFCKFYHDDRNSKIQLFLSSLYLGYLALTKVFFGYVILTGLLLFMILYIIKKGKKLKNSLMVYLLALCFCLPYLFYTYSLTGKIFYWGNSGGLSLYWMATPFTDELGDWHNTKEVIENPLLKHHSNFYDEIKDLSSIQRDEALRNRAIINIINNPLKYFRNWLNNIGRLLFHYPYTYVTPRLKIYYFGHMIPGMFLFVLSVLCIYPSYVGRKIIPYEIYALVIFALIAFAGSSLVSAYSRQFQPLVPVFALWIFFTLSRVIKIEIRQ